MAFVKIYEEESVRLLSCIILISSIRVLYIRIIDDPVRMKSIRVEDFFPA